MKSISNHKNSYFTTLIIISFIILSFLEIYLIWPHHILNGNDFYFHLERLEDLVKSNKLLPQFSFYSFSNNGSAVMTMYPYLLLYPFALLIKLIGHINFVIYFMYISNAFITLMISYFSSLHLTCKRNISYIFALIYSLSFEYITLNCWSSDFGMSWSATFMPLVLFGYIYWLKNNKWIMLSIGISLLIYSNIPVTVFTPILLFIWTLFNYKLINKNHILNLVKAIILTLLTTALFLLPACKFIILNHHFLGTVNLGGRMWEVKPTALIATLIPTLSFKFNSWFPWELTIPSLLGFIIATIRFKHLTWLLKQFYLFSLFILILSSSFFIWKLPITYKISGLIQTTIRMYLIPQILLSYIFTIYIIKFLNRIDHNKTNINLFTILICVLLAQIAYIGIFHSQQNISTGHANGILKTSFFNASKSNPSKSIDYYIGTKDTTKDIMKNNGLTNDGHKIHFTNNKKNGLTFSSKKDISKLSLPILKYNGVKYHCSLDNKSIKSFSNKKLVTIKNIQKGTHNVKVSTITDKTTKISYILAGISILIYLILISTIIISHVK